jgi:hypothetical protein
VWWIVSASTVTHNTNYDTVVFNLDGQASSVLGSEVECYLPPGGNVMLDYSYRIFQFFDTWN